MRNRRRETSQVVLEKIIGYCNQIDDLINEFGNSYENYVSKAALKLSCDMCVFQIGELTTRFTEEFKNQHREIDWRKIRALRNIHAHEYETVDLEEMWKILSEDIPAFKERLTTILETMRED
ncbi:MAG: DUF86 domain-containing protein [Selenomonadaceae bacterium]|nr:DUF86 domain-containing protein [Selenomonadaceae bacterium]